MHEKLSTIVILLLLILYNRLHYTNTACIIEHSVKSIPLLSPHNLIQSLENLFKEQGEILVYKPEFQTNPKYQTILINLIFYFNLFQLPYFALTLLNSNEDILNEVMFDMQKVINQSKEGKSTSIFKISTIKRLETIYTKKPTYNAHACPFNKHETLVNKQFSRDDTLMSKQFNRDDTLVSNNYNRNDTLMSKQTLNRNDTLTSIIIKSIIIL